jgi:hypothetical protein
MTEWRTDFENAPRDGTRFEIRREDCPGYDTTATLDGGKFSPASWFIRSDMKLIKTPTHWRPISEAAR